MTAYDLAKLIVPASFGFYLGRLRVEGILTTWQVIRSVIVGALIFSVVITVLETLWPIK